MVILRVSSHGGLAFKVSSSPNIDASIAEPSRLSNIPKIEGDALGPARVDVAFDQGAHKCESLAKSASKSNNPTQKALDRASPHFRPSDCFTAAPSLGYAASQRGDEPVGISVVAQRGI